MIIDNNNYNLAVFVKKNNFDYLNYYIYFKKLAIIENCPPTYLCLKFNNKQPAFVLRYFFAFLFLKSILSCYNFVMGQNNKTIFFKKIPKKLGFNLIIIVILLISASFAAGAVIGPEFFSSIFSINFLNNSEANRDKLTAGQKISETETALSRLLNKNKKTEQLNQAEGILNPNCDQSAVLEQAKQCSYVVATNLGHGSGFAITENFLITNKHVVSQAESIYTFIDGDKQDLLLWNYSSDSDLAVLKSERVLEPCQWAESDQILLAETLFAVGWPNSPEGEASITRGIFSRFIQTDEGPTFIQTDAAINPGSSGGPLLSSCGIVGINTAKISWSQGNVPAEGFSFAIASNYAQQVIEKLLAAGYQHELPVQQLTLTQYSYAQTEQSLQDDEVFSITAEGRKNWLKAAAATKELVDFWQDPADDIEFDAEKLTTLKDLIARMQAVMKVIQPKIEDNQLITQEEERLLQQWLNMYQQVLEIEGELYGRDFSQGYFHLKCQANSCVLTAGRGQDQCSQAQDCMPNYYYSCEGLTCIVKEGNQKHECTSHDDCYYYTCRDESCVKVEGSGEDECLLDWQCSQD